MVQGHASLLVFCVIPRAMLVCPVFGKSGGGVGRIRHRGQRGGVACTPARDCLHLDLPTAAGREGVLAVFGEASQAAVTAPMCFLFDINRSGGFDDAPRLENTRPIRPVTWSARLRRPLFPPSPPLLRPHGSCRRAVCTWLVRLASPGSAPGEWGRLQAVCAVSLRALLLECYPCG